MQLRESIARIVAVSAIYAMIEAYFSPEHQGNVISIYHLLVLLIGLTAGFDRNIKITIANVLSFSVLEDAFYWIFKGQLPYAWSSEYVVVAHIPIYYIPYLTLAILLYKKVMNDEGEHSLRK
jgi:hypothetical protein